MTEYIEREALLNEIAEIHKTHGLSDDEEMGLSESDIRGLLLCIPAADVVPVRHGRWIPSESDFDDDGTLFDVEEWCDWQCSVCREDVCYEDPMECRMLPKFCPNCGAKMDGGAGNAAD